MTRSLAALAITTLLGAPAAAQLLPPPGDGDIRVVYWDLLKQTEVWLTLEPRSPAGERAPLLTFTDRFRGRRPAGPRREVEVRAYVGTFWAPRAELWLLADGQRIEFGSGARQLGFVSGAPSDFLSETISIEMLKQIGAAERVTGVVLGFEVELTAAQRQALRMFLVRVLSDDPAPQPRPFGAARPGDGRTDVAVGAGRGGRPGESRLDLLRDNAAVVREIGRRLAGCRGILVVVTNPVDVLTQVLAEAAGLPLDRVIGTGTMLDTARLRHVVGRALRLDPRSVHGLVVGEHGDSEVVLWSGARVGGVPLRSWPGWAPGQEPRLAEEVRTAAYEIIRRKGATNHAIGLVTAELLRCMLRGERRVLTVSRVQEGVLGLRGVALSMPTVVGADGAVEVLAPEMSGDERARLEASAGVLRRAFEQLRAA